MPRKVKKHKIKLSTHFNWMFPYIKLAWEMGIPIHKLKSISGYSTPPSRLDKVWGWTHYNKDGTFRIRIMDQFQVLRKDKKKRIYVAGYLDHDYKWKFEFTLNTLAHELTHLIYYDHSPERFILEQKLMIRFAKLAKKLGYKGY